MIEGWFDDEGKLHFEIELVGTDGLLLPVDVLLDTGSTEWLVMNEQDIDGLGWAAAGRRTFRMVQGETKLNLYVGKIRLDGQDFDIPISAGMAVENYLIGVPWLQTKRLVADIPAGLLTLG